MEIKLLLPEILILSLAVLVLFIDWATPVSKKRFAGIACAIGLGIVFLVILYLDKTGFFPTVGYLSITLSGGKNVFQGFVLDNFAVFFKEIFSLVALVAAVLSLGFFGNKTEGGQGEYYPLFLFATLGCFLLVSASDLLTLFVSFELMSIPLYILSGYLRRDSKSSEAGLKYFLIGAVTSALLVYGISLVYGSLGTTDLRPGILTVQKIQQNPLLLFGLLFILSAFAFKIASVPFHMWAPDVYEGAPTPVVAFLAVAPKIAVIGILMRLFLANFAAIQPLLVSIFGLLAALSMTVGNLAALSQQNLKRLLAYSGIAQMGYILVGFASVQSGVFPSAQPAYQAILFYVVAYAFSDLAAFGVVTVLSSQGREDVRSLQGLATRYPVLAFIFLVSLLSLAGVPPLIGFIGKFYLFAAAIAGKLYWLAALGFANSVVSLFYYLRVGKSMYFEKGAEELQLAAPSFSMQTALWFVFLVVLFVGIYPAVIIAKSPAVLSPLSNIPLGF